MSVLNPGTTFSNGEQLTADLLNDLVSQATFTDASIDNQSTEISGASIIVKDEGIIGSKIATGAVAFTKLAPAMVINSNTMSGASSTTLATSGSIKQYVDTSITANALVFSPSTYTGGESVTLPNGLIMKFGTVSGVDPTVSFLNYFPTVVMSVQLTARTSYNDQTGNACFASNVSVSGFNITNGRNSKPNDTINWFAIGY
jgi:hypothetical protein